MVPINKDFEKEFKEEAFGGYTLRECLLIAGILLADAGIYLFLTVLAGLDCGMVIYFCIPVTLLLGFMSFKRYQDLTFLQMLKARKREKDQQVLVWKAGENKWEMEDGVSREIAKRSEKRRQKRREKRR